MIPRLMIAAPGSNAGKTMVTCALLKVFQKRGLRVMAFKSGPDYIDPMFHSRVIGAESRNLDGFFFDTPTLRGLLQKNARGCDLAIMESAMGFYDGVGLGSQASGWALSHATGTPVVLVVDGRGAALSLAATVSGFRDFEPESGLAGVILNRVSPGLYPRLAECIAGRTGVPVLGYLPALPECTIESRHLGLLTADEVCNLQSKIEKLAETAEKTLDIQGLYQLAKGATPLTEEAPLVKQVTDRRPRIAIARDRAFCFYYADALELLEQLGAELAPFSPLEESALPEGISGLYLGGGYPELYARQLSGNTAMRNAIRQAVEKGLPTVAECGGFMYLHKTLEDGEGTPWEMVGVLKGSAFRTNRLGRFGYVTLTAQRTGLLFEKGQQIPGHEFHYWDSTDVGADFRADKPQSNRGWQTGVMTDSLYAGFPHIHFCAGPQAAGRFVLACADYLEKNET